MEFFSDSRFSVVLKTIPSKGGNSEQMWSTEKAL